LLVELNIWNGESGWRAMGKGGRLHPNEILTKKRGGTLFSNATPAEEEKEPVDLGKKDKGLVSYLIGENKLR